MKKPQKNFAVEYKGVRRKPSPQSNSIWGNLDLRRFAAQPGEGEASGPSEPRVNSDAIAHHASSSPMSTAEPQQTTKSILALEKQMADDTSMSEQVSIEPEMALPKAPEPKQRGPRSKKVAADAGSTDALLDAPAVKKTRAKRGSKIAVAEVKPAGRRGGRKAKAAVEEIFQSSTQSVSPVTAAGEEMEDLLQLEQENQRLRKLLAGKLREENADLRKRLGLD